MTARQPRQQRRHLPACLLVTRLRTCWKLTTNRNAGTGKTLTVTDYLVTDGNSGNNYAVTTVNDTTGSITARAITVKAVTNTKTYDGTTTAAAIPIITTGSLNIGDTGNFIETYDTKNVGTGKTLTASGAVKDGNGGNNYVVTFLTDTTGEIDQANLTIAAATNTKAYDTTLTASATPTVTGLKGTPIRSAGLSEVLHGSKRRHRQ